MNRIDTEQLEQELRAARTAYDDVPVSPDAWQRNQELVAASMSSDRHRTVNAVAASVLVLLVITVGWLALGGKDVPQGVPGSGGDAKGEMRSPVEVARVDLPDGAVALEVGLDASSSRPDEPYLCDRFTSVTSSGGNSETAAGGCTPKVDRADLPGVTVDYLTGGTGETWTALTGAVDAHTAKLTMWQADGTTTDLELHQLAGSELRAFGFLTNGPTVTRPARLVAWADAAGTEVLESVDVVDRFDLTWLPGEKADCASVQRVPEARFPAADDRPEIVVQASFIDAKISFALPNDGRKTVCLPMDQPAAATRVSPGWAVVVVSPEVAAVETVTAEAQPFQPVGTTMWRTTLVPTGDEQAELALVDVAGVVLQRITVGPPR